MGVRKYRTIVLASTVAVVSLALISVDITSAAEPSHVETWIASSLLFVKVRAQKHALPNISLPQMLISTEPARCISRCVHSVTALRGANPLLLRRLFPLVRRSL